MCELKVPTVDSAIFFFKSIVIFCIAVLPLRVTGSESKADDGKTFDPSQDFYQYDAVDLKGNVVPLKRFRGKACLVVNVASECGYTDQHYKDMVKLQKELGPTDRFSVLAFPCNQFGGQEPGTSKEIEMFAKRKYSANFPIFGKINVTGDDVPSSWKLLIAESGQAPTWNFFKYLVDGKGHVINVWGPWVDIADIKNDIHEAVEELTPPDLPYREHHDEHHEHEEL